MQGCIGVMTHMKIASLYQKYAILPSLALHQYRVAAVGMATYAGIRGDVRKQVDRLHPGDAWAIPAACLLHDMGNILKFNMSLFPQFFEPEGVAFWQEVQSHFRRRYGNDEHVATRIIAEEILAPCHDDHRDRTLALIDAIGFSQACEHAKTDDLGKQIVMYADCRVEPHGVTTLEDRLREGHARYRKNKGGNHDPGFFVRMSQAVRDIEQQIGALSDSDPRMITEDSVTDAIARLSDFEIPVKMTS